MPNQKSICVLSHSFKVNATLNFGDLNVILRDMPKGSNPILIVDPKKYYDHIHNENGILNAANKNIYQYGFADFESSSLFDIQSLSLKHIYLDDKRQIRLELTSIKWVIILDPRCELGMLFYMFDLKVQSENCLEVLSQTKIFRFLRPPGRDSSMCNLKVYDNEVCVGHVSLYSIFESCFPKLSKSINFLESKPIQFHYLDQIAYNYYLDSVDSKNEFEREAHCYNLLRIPQKPNEEVEMRYFEKNQNHVYENSSIYAFAMAEGIVMMSAYKSPKELVSKFFAAHVLSLFPKKLVHMLPLDIGVGSSGDFRISSETVGSLKQARKEISLISYITSMPVSQDTDIQEVFTLGKSNFFSGGDHMAVKSALNDLNSILLEEAESADAERERKIALFIGVLGITGFISFLFDYLVIDKNRKLIDTLEFPYNALPFLLFLLIFIFIWNFLRRR